MQRCEPLKWLNGTTLKTCRREVPGSVPRRDCQPRRSEFQSFFFQNSCKYGLGFLRKTPHGRHFHCKPRSHELTIDFNSTTQSNKCSIQSLTSFSNVGYFLSHLQYIFFFSLTHCFIDPLLYLFKNIYFISMNMHRLYC